MIDFSNIDGIVLYVRDMERALAFYTKVLGLEVVNFESGFVTLKTQGVQLHLHRADNPPGIRLGQSVKFPQVSFKVQNLEEALHYLRSANVQITREIVEYEPSTFVFNFLDPDGNPLACESDTRN